MVLSELPSSEYNPFYQTYVMALGNVELIEELVRGKDELLSLLKEIPEQKLDYAYAEGKWSLAEALIHVIDTERVFQYRALCFARNDKTPLPGFDVDAYVPYSNATNRSKASLAQEYKAVRDSTIALFNSFDKEAIKRIGLASDSKMSVRALGFIISGHQAHHVRIIKERYLA
ncbi:MAG: DinB family protein [Bacteroidota bacterium]|uniref:DinB family protein n=1 Tax=Flagellimonas profundi TaxID=2915620 RepID=A0ABS3FCL5_9FLAO|nr:DinB family protein [Allomuricauda profundi]MBO0340889.1 DinB family protein [Allomuricauda profundi]MEC7771943.1 DinB family protein [Bacteroidota bacterium]